MVRRMGPSFPWGHNNSQGQPLARTTPQHRLRQGIHYKDIFTCWDSYRHKRRTRNSIFKRSVGRKDPGSHKDSKPDGPFKSLVISSKDNGQQGDGSFKRFPEPGSIIRLFNYSKTPRGDSRQTGISSFIGIILKTVIQLPPSCIFWPVIKFRCRFFRTFKLQPRHKLRQQQFAVIVAAKLQQKQQLTVKLQPLEQFSTKQVKL